LKVKCLLFLILAILDYKKILHRTFYIAYYRKNSKG